MNKYVVCIDNTGQKASLEVMKIYKIISDKDAEKDGMLRVIDNSGEDYLHSEDRFVPIKLDKRLVETLEKSLSMESVY